MLAEGVIEPPQSDWASTIILVRKKDNSIRLCVDYRKLNAQSRIDAYPIPRIEDILDKVGKVKFITTLDLARGYWQVPVADEETQDYVHQPPLVRTNFGRTNFVECHSDLMEHQLPFKSS